MRRRFQGLHQADQSAASDVPDGIFMVRIQRSQYRWHAQKPFYTLRFTVVEPLEQSGNTFSARLYCSPRALWKLNWFLRDFGYDADLLGHDEVEDKKIVGLIGVVKVSHTVLNGTRLLNLDAFAPALQWEDLRAIAKPQPSTPEAA